MLNIICDSHYLRYIFQRRLSIKSLNIIFLGTKQFFEIQNNYTKILRLKERVWLWCNPMSHCLLVVKSNNSVSTFYSKSYCFFTLQGMRSIYSFILVRKLTLKTRLVQVSYLYPKKCIQTVKNKRNLELLTNNVPQIKIILPGEPAF